MDSKEKLIHCLWTIGFLVFCMILLVTLNLGSNPEVANLISVGTGLVSLVVGVIAITYAFITNNSLSETSARLKDSSTTIQEVARSVALSLENMGKEISPTLSDVSKKITEMHSKANAAMQELPPSDPPQKPPASGTTIDADQYVEHFLKVSSWWGLLALYLAKEAHKKDVTVNLNIWATTVKGVPADYVFGYIVCTIAAQMMNYDLKIFQETGSIKFTRISKRLSDRLDTIMNENLTKANLGTVEYKDRLRQKSETDEYLTGLVN